MATCLIAGIVAAMSGDRLRYKDERDYHNLAQSLIQNGAYLGPKGEPTAYRPPGYPFVLAGIYQVSNRPIAAKAVNVLALALTGLMLALIAERVVPGSGVVAGAITALYPLFIYTGATLYPQVFALCLLAAGVMLLVDPKRRLWQAAAAGVLFGYLTLTIGSFQLFVPLIVLWLAWQARHVGTRALVQALLFAVMAAAVVAPWTYRNWQVLGAVVPVSSNGGVNLLVGNNKNAGPDTGLFADITEYREQARALAAGEVKRDAFMRQAAIDWITANPVDAAVLYVGKWLNHWNFTNDTKTDGGASPAAQAVLFISFYPLLIVVIARLWFWRRVPLSTTETFLLLLVLANAFISAIFFTRVRFRLPFDGPLIALAAIAIGHGLRARGWLPAARVGAGSRRS